MLKPGELSNVIHIWVDASQAETLFFFGGFFFFFYIGLGELNVQRNANIITRAELTQLEIFKYNLADSKLGGISVIILFIPRFYYLLYLFTYNITHLSSFFLTSILYCT